MLEKVLEQGFFLLFIYLFINLVIIEFPQMALKTCKKVQQNSSLVRVMS